MLYSAEILSTQLREYVFDTYIIVVWCDLFEGEHIDKAILTDRVVNKLYILFKILQITSHNIKYTKTLELDFQCSCTHSSMQQFHFKFIIFQKKKWNNATNW